LRNCEGVIHIGANEGQERGTYNLFKLNVLWIEPIPEIYNKLLENIKEFSLQRALNYLILDRDNIKVILNISNNNGLSSSIFELDKHKNIWPDVYYSSKISLNSITLPSLLKKEFIPIKQYDCLIMDTQGSELLILKGCEQILQNFKYVKTEVANFEAYTGCCQLSEMNAWMASKGFRIIKKQKKGNKKEIGSYYDITYINKNYKNE